jgi:hypothetical protein
LCIYIIYGTLIYIYIPITIWLICIRLHKGLYIYTISILYHRIIWFM